MLLGFATPAAASAGTQLFNESFAGAALNNPSGVFLPAIVGGKPNEACLTASGDVSAVPLPGCEDPALDTAPNGVLRLTPAKGQLAGALFASAPAPTGGVLDVQFDSYQWGGGGFMGDGLALVLTAVDPNVQTPPATNGGTGGTLGYTGIENGYLGIGLDVFGNYSREVPTAAADRGCTPAAWVSSTAQKNEVSVRGPGKNVAGTSTGYCLINSTYNPDLGIAQPVLNGANRAAAKVPVRITINPTAEAVTLPGTSDEVPALSYRVQFTGVGQSVQAFTGALPDATGFYDSAWLDANGVPKQLAFGWSGSTGGAVNNHEVAQALNASVFPTPVVSSEVKFEQTPDQPVGTGTYVVTAKVTGATLDDVLTVRGSVGSQLSLEAIDGDGWECSVSGRNYTCTRPGPILVDAVVPPIRIDVLPQQAVLEADLPTQITVRSLSPDAQGSCVGNCAVSAVSTPEAPTGLTAAPGNGQVTIAFVAGGDGGAPITNYEYSTDGSTWTALDPADDTSPLTIRGLTNGTVYDIALRAVNDAGEGTASAPVTVTPGVPLAPTNLVAAPGNGSASIAFTPGNNNGAPITNYKYSLDGGATWKAVVPPTAGSPVAIAGLTNGTQYSILLQGVNANGDGVPSAPVMVTPSTVPTAPTALAAEPADGALTISFTQGGDGGSAITNYQYSVDGGKWTPLNPADASSPVTVPGLTNGTQYAVALRAVNPNGASLTSATVTATPSTTPDAPTGLTAERGNGEATLKFTAPASDGGSPVTNYEYTIDGGTTWVPFDPAETGSPALVRGLTNGTPYDISLRAVNDRGVSPVAGPVTVTPATVPGAVEMFDAEPLNRGVEIFVEGPTSDGGSPITNYEYSTDGGAAWVPFDPPVTDAGFIREIAGLINGTTAQVQVRALNDVGFGPVSEVAEVVVGSPTSPIGEVVPGDGSVVIEFDTSSVDDNGAAVEGFEYSLDSGKTWVRPDPDVTESPITVEGLTNGTTVDVQLRAFNDRGAGPASEFGEVVVGSPTAPEILEVVPGLGQLTIGFTPADGNGEPVTNYEYSVDEGVTWVRFDPAVTGSPVTITGLTDGQFYLVLLRGINDRGAGGEAEAFGTPGTPTAPTNLVATIGDEQVEITFTPGNDNGSPITNFLYSLDGGETFMEFDPAQGSSPVTITGLTNGESYSVVLVAINARGEGQESAPVVVEPASVPGAVEFFGAGPLDGELNVFVVGPQDTGGLPITNYEYSLDGGKTWTAFDPAQTESVVAAVIPGLTNGDTYEVAVRAVNDLGGGAESPVIEVIVGAPTVPPGRALPGNGSLTIEFEPDALDDNGDPVTGFEYSLDGGVTWIDAGTTTSPIIVNGLANGTTYDVQLRALNGRGPGAVAEYGEVTVGAPTAPVIETVVPGSGQVTVEFTPAGDNGDPVTNYEYQLTRLDDTTPGPWVAFDPPVTGGPVTIPNLTDGVTYLIELRAINGRGPGFSDIAVVTPGSPTAPTNLAVTPGDGSATISFTPGSDNGSPITNYSFIVVPDGGMGYFGTFDPAQATSPVTIDGLTNGVGHTIVLIPINARGEGQQSASVFVTPAGPPLAPTEVVANAGPGSVALSFTGADDNGSPITGYEYTVDGGATWTAFVPPVTGSPAIITGLSSGEEVEVSIRAVNDVGPGEASEPVSVTPVGTPGAVELFRAGPRDGGVEVFVVAPSNTGGLPITNYEYSLDGGKTWTAFDPAETESEFGAVIPSLNNGETYEVAVRAVNDLGGGTESPVVEVVVGAPTAPPGGVVPGDGELIIEFEPDEVVDNGDPVTGFEYSLDGGKTWIDGGSATSPIIVTGLVNGTTYEVALRALNGRGPGGVAEYGEVIVGSPAAPMIETVVPGSGQLTLEFTPAPDNGDPVTNYQYRLTTVDDPTPGPWVDFAPPVTGSPATIGGLTDGVGYLIELRAVNGRGPGVSDIAGGTPGSPTAPADLEAAPGDGSVTITFTPGSDNGSPITNYTALVVPENGPPFFVTLDPPQATSPVTIDGLTNGTGYTIFLIPINALGEGQESASVSVTPRTTADAPTGLSATAGFAAATVSFTAPGEDGGAPVTNYQYSLDFGVSWTALDPAQASSPVMITGLPNGVTSTIVLRAVNEAGGGAMSEPVEVTPLGSVFVPVTPYRAYDSRDGDGPLSAGAPRMVETEVPDGAVAVAYNLTAVGMTGSGFLAVAPGGAPAGGTSTLNYTAPGQQWANAFTSGVDAEGRVQVSVGGAATQFVVDVVGYYAPQTMPNGVKGAAVAPATEGSLFVPMTPQRAYDSRDTGAGGPLGNGAPRKVNVTAGGLVPPNATAVAYTLTQTGTVGRGVLTVAPAGEQRPAVSNINWFQDNQTSANSSVVGITEGFVDVWTGSSTGGSAEFVIDILGYYLPAEEAPWAAAFTPIDPQRAYDSRKDTPAGPIIGGGKPFTTSMAVPGVPLESVAVAFNLTAAGGTNTGYLTTTPGDVLSPPVASTINWWQPNQTLANGTVVDVPSLPRLTGTGALNGGPKLPVNTFAGGGNTQYVIDVAGYFTANPFR